MDPHFPRVSALLWQTRWVDSCQTCEGLSERFRIATPEEYRESVRQLKEMVGRGSLKLVHADCPLEDILNQPQWPGDVLVHDFQCAACGRGFHLCADTYHGHVDWSPRGASDSN